MFIAEAPGRLGAAKTGIPLHGDRTGQRFDMLLSAMDLPRQSVFISNAVLCNPRDQYGNNSTPRREEIIQCSRLLRRTVDLVNPPVIIALGRVALEAVGLLCRHELALRDSVGKLVPWFGRRLGVLYHPGPRTAVHRNWSKQMKDARSLGKVIRRIASEQELLYYK